MLTLAPQVELPPLPPVGLPEATYVRRIRAADLAGDHHLHESLKVGQYLTLASDDRQPWPQRLRCYRHAATHHGMGPAIAPGHVLAFYGDLLMLIRDHCGAAALRLASGRDDEFARHIRQGRAPGQVAEDAAEFFDELLGGRRFAGPGVAPPAWFHPDDWTQLLVFRAQWVE